MPARPTSGTVPSLSCLVTGIQGTSYPQSICCPHWAKGHVIHYLNTSPTPPHPTPQVTKGAQPCFSAALLKPMAVPWGPRVGGRIPECRFHREGKHRQPEPGRAGAWASQPAPPEQESRKAQTYRCLDLPGG